MPIFEVVPLVLIVLFVMLYPEFAPRPMYIPYESDPAAVPSIKMQFFTVTFSMPPISIALLLPNPFVSHVMVNPLQSNTTPCEVGPKVIQPPIALTLCVRLPVEVIDEQESTSTAILLTLNSKKSNITTPKYTPFLINVCKALYHI